MWRDLSSWASAPPRTSVAVLPRDRDVACRPSVACALSAQLRAARTVRALVVPAEKRFRVRVSLLEALERIEREVSVRTHAIVLRLAILLNLCEFDLLHANEFLQFTLLPIDLFVAVCKNIDRRHLL